MIDNGIVGRRQMLLALTCFGVATTAGRLADADDRIFQAATATQVLKRGAGEGPAWDPKLGLLFSGGAGIMQLDRQGKVSVFRRRAGTNGLLFDAKGRLLSCVPAKRHVSRTERDGRIVVLAERYGGKRFNQPNDITVDSHGRIYFSDPQYGDRSSMEMLDDKGRKVEGVYRIDPDGKVTRIITHEVDRPNGLVVTADDRYLYVADNNNNEKGGARKLWRFGLQKDGGVDLKSRRLMYDWGDSRGPDGMVLDARGRLFVAGGLNADDRTPIETNTLKGGVYVFSPKGKLVAFVRVPRDEVTNCTFGGDDLKTLYITAGGTLWSIRTTVPGRMPWPPAARN